MKQWLKIVGLGIGIWGLSLFWPYINQFLTPDLMVVLVLGLAATSLIYLMVQDSDHDHHDGHRGEGVSYSPPKLIQLNDHS